MTFFTQEVVQEGLFTGSALPDLVCSIHLELTRTLYIKPEMTVVFETMVQLPIFSI